MGPRNLKDSQWVRHAFLVSRKDLDVVDVNNRSFTSARFKFWDTTPGGNICINPPPQFTRTADTKVVGRFGKSHGMGRYYSEAIDDHNQIVHMRFGVPQFNSLTTFFTGFYNTGASQLARTGRSESLFFQLGRAAGFVVSIMHWKILAAHMIGNAYRFLAKKPSSKYYYLKPTMPLYWNAVSTIVNQIAVNRGIVPRVLAEKDQGGMGEPYVFDDAARKKLHSLLPDIFNESGSIDVFALANRGQRLARIHHHQMSEAKNNESNFDPNKILREQLNAPIVDNKRRGFLQHLEDWFKADASKPTPVDGDGNDTSVEARDTKLDSGFWNFLAAEMDDGSAFASFRVNSTGSVNESFSNSVGESEIANKINSMSSQSRSTNFSFANGNLDDGIIGKTIGGILGAVKDVASGVASGLGISGLAALGGAAFVDIPKHWQSSTANLPRSTYTIDLVSPYGNPVSQLFNIHLPLAMLLAGALPLSTGKQSYTSPFILEMYDQGRNQIRLGMIDSLTITRGTGNLGFNADGNVMAIQVSFSIVDMSSILHMPISQGMSLTRTLVGGVAGAAAGGAVGAAAGASIANGLFDEDTAYSDYLAVLAGMGLADQIYSIPKLKLNMTRQAEEWKNWTSPARFASFAGDIWPARLISAIFTGVNK